MDADSKLEMPSGTEIDLAVEVFRMLSDGTRLRLLWCLLESERSVGELADAVGKKPSATSQHLAKLRLARLVQTRREGNTIYYRLESDHARQIVLDGIYHAEHQEPETPAHHRSDRPVQTIRTAGSGA